MKQHTIYGDIVNQFHNSPRKESKSESASLRLTGSQKIALEKLAQEKGCSLSNMASLLIEAGLRVYPNQDKLERHESIFATLLQRLP